MIREITIPMKHRLRVTINYGLVAANSLVFLVLVVISYYNNQMIKDIHEERIEHQIREDLNTIQLTLNDAQRRERGFLITGEMHFLDNYDNSKKELEETFQNLKNTINSTNGELTQSQVNFSKHLIDETLTKFDEIIRLKRANIGAKALISNEREGKIYMDSLHNFLSKIKAAEADSINLRIQDSESSLMNVKSLSIGGGVLLLFIMAFISIALSKDVFQREKVTHDLEETEKKFDFLFELSNDGILVTDLKDTIINCNKALCKILGYKKEELIGSSYKKLYTEDVAADLPSALSTKTVSEEIETERTALKKDGTVIYTEFNSKFLELDGESMVITFMRDITDKKNAHNELIKNKERYRQLFEKSKSAIFKTTLDGKILECNNVYADALGFSSTQEIKSVNTKNFYYDINDRDEFISILREKGELQNYTIRLKKKDGSYIWALENIALLYDEDLHEMVLFGSFLDVTSQKQADILLERSEKKYRDLAELLPQTVFELDSKGKLVFANKNGLKVFGYSQEDWKNEINALQFFAPYEREKFVDRFSKSMRGDKLTFTEYAAIKKDGTIFPCLVFSEPVYEEKIEGGSNNIVGIRGILIDISEQQKYRRENNLLAHVIRGVSELISVTDLDNNFIFVNNAFLNAYGYTQEELIGKNISIIVSDNEKINLSSKVMQNTLSGNWHGEILNKRKDGSTFPVFLSTSLVKDEAGKSIAAVGVATDITQWKKMLNELIQAKEKAENADKLKTEFLAQISHEIRTPLVGIVSYTDLIKSELEAGQPADFYNYLDTIKRSGKRIERTITLIINVSEVYANTYDYNPVELDIADDIILPLSKKFQIEAEAKQLDFQFVNYSNNSIVKADEYSLMQIFSNLIENAIIYTRDGFVKLEVSKQEDTIIAKVIDSGIGISEDFLPYIFEPFRQEEQGYTRSYDGNGLGLTLVKKYCEINNADIEVNSLKGKGSIFTVAFRTKERADYE